MKTIFAILFVTIVSLTAFSQSNQESTIINLFDAFGKENSLIKDWGFSCIIKYQGKTILFDTGSNADIFKSNVTKLGIDLQKIDIVIVSHSHFDHTHGIDYLLTKNPKVKIYLPNDIDLGAPPQFNLAGPEPEIKDSIPAYQQYFDGKSTITTVNQSGRYWNANTEYIKESKEIFKGVHLITTRSNYVGFFSCYPSGNSTNDNECRQFGLAELSLSLKTDTGEILIVGCSHSGVDNIIAETKKVANSDIDLVYGGFHTIPFDRKTISVLADKLKNEFHVKRVAPAHCTGHLGFKIFQDRFGSGFLYAGLGSSIKY